MDRSRSRAKEPPLALDRIRWKGEQSFRMLSYYFSVRWNIEAAGDQILYALRDFAVPQDAEEHPEIWAPSLPPNYSIVRRGSGKLRYHLLYGNDVMLTTNTLDRALANLFWQVNTQTIRQSGDFLLIHAGAVSTPAGEGILLPSVSGGGKTTLVTALVRRGFSYLSDEGGAVDPVSRELYPYHRPLSLKEGHAHLFPDLCERANGSDWAVGQRWIHPEDVRPGAVGGPCPIRFVIAHQYRPGTPTEITPLTPAQGAMELLTNALNLPRYRSRALPLVADVARRARSYRLVSGNLEEAVQTIIELTGERRRAATRAI